LLRADFFDSDSFFENEMVSKLEQSRSASRGAVASSALRDPESGSPVIGRSVNS